MKTAEKTVSKAGRQWDRVAPMYDRVVQLLEREQFHRWRSLLWSKVEGKDILEVGVGTGRNFSHADTVACNITAIDISQGMLKRARKRAAESRLQIDLHLMDVQDLRFPDNSFDTVVGSLVFCSVTNPVLGMTEVKRVCKPDGKVLFLVNGH